MCLWVIVRGIFTTNAEESDVRMRRNSRIFWGAQLGIGSSCNRDVKVPRRLRTFPVITLSWMRGLDSVARIAAGLKEKCALAPVMSRRGVVVGRAV